MITNKQRIELLTNHVTENRINRINEIVENRQRYLTIGLENIFQPHNASAVLRSCDCFGVQDVHIIENSNKYKVNRDVSLGSNKWLDLHKYNKKENNTLDAINSLKEQGYRIVATSPHKNAFPLPEFDLNKGKAVIIFGTELTGISDIVKDNADEFLYMPMFGFTESFNISVCAAMILHTLTEKLRASDIKWQLTEDEKDILRLDWLRKTVKSSVLIEETLNKK